MKDLIHRINPPGLIKPHRGALFSTIGTVFDKVRLDAEKAFFAHFPYMADMAKLSQHGKALSIPRFGYDSDEEYRKRVATAAFYYTHAGERSYTTAQLQEHFRDRYTLIESFLNVHIKVLDLTDADKKWLRDFFDSTLDPNILFSLTEWFNFVETVTVGDIPLITAVRKDWDIYPRGLRYDGRIKYDHGREIRLDGNGAYDGAWHYGGVIPKPGTISDYIRIPEWYNGTRTYGGEITYSGDAEVWAPEAIPNPATYGSGQDDDTLSMRLKTVSGDQAELYLAFDGRLSYNGAVTYGGTQPDMVDDSQIAITHHVSLTDTVESSDATSIIEMVKADQDIYPSGLRYDGRIKYDHGIAPRFDGSTKYDGSVRYDKVIAKPGTVIDSVHGDIAASAQYDNNREQDSLKEQITLEPFADTVSIRPYFDGEYAYKGAIAYGELPSLIDGDMPLKITNHVTYDGRKQYGVRQYNGTAQYNNAITFLDGETYAGNKETREAV
jgi:hypothetical protein